MYGQNTDQVETPMHRLRSGRAYLGLPSALSHPRSILKTKTEDSLEPDLLLNKPPAYTRAYETAKAHGLASVQIHLGTELEMTKIPKLKLTKRSFRFHIKTGNAILDYYQPVIDQEDKVILQNDITSTVYLMLTSLALDTSRREILHRTYWSEPMPSNDQVNFVLNVKLFVDHHLS